MTNEEKSLQQYIDEAVQKYFADNGGGFVRSWFIAIDGIDDDGGEIWNYATMPDQRLMVSMGLVDWISGALQYEQQRYLHEISED